jgi:drug/metabolite transporter superfamily protein YnfA
MIGPYQELRRTAGNTSGRTTADQRVRLIADRVTVQSIFLISPRNKTSTGIRQFPASIAKRVLRNSSRNSGLKDMLTQLVAMRSGAFVVMLFAAFLEVCGDSWFQSGLHRATGAPRYLAFAGGALTLALYGLVVNAPPWDFGKLIGSYVVLFFLVAQIVAWIRFQQTPTPPIVVGGSLILAGGAVITFWKA